MKNYIKILMGILFAILILGGCDEIPDGYIADSILYTTNPINVPAGVTTYSLPPNLAGTSFPVQVELLEVRNADGEIDTVFAKPRDLYIWKEPFDNTVDTTLEAMLAKREIQPNQPTMHVIAGSGQLLFTEATKEVDPGQYSLTLKMTNSAGTRIYKDVLTVNLENIPYSYNNQNHNIAATGSGWVEPGATKPSDTRGAVISPAEFTVTHDPDGPNKLHLIIRDKNDSPWNWANKEIVKRGDRPCLEYALPWEDGEFKETELVYNYPFAPFPIGTIYTINSSGGKDSWPARFDYRIMNDYVAISGLTPGKWNCNLVFYFKFNFSGEWTFDLKFPNLTRIQP